MFYDTFALRDAEGYAPLMETWPYFRNGESRNAAKHGPPIPVASCWNGMVVFDAAPFYNIERPLSFRGIYDSLAESHLEGSECCLIHADNMLSRTKGVWVNPSVRVGYNGTTYEEVDPNNGGSWPSTRSIVVGLWQNRIKRWLHRCGVDGRAVADKVSAWRQQGPANQEPGSFCLINEMQIMLWNGWGHA